MASEKFLRPRRKNMASEKFLRPRRESAETKAETTKRVSEEITRTEAELRDAKTMRLRAARLANEENRPEPAKTKRSPGKARSARKQGA